MYQHIVVTTAGEHLDHAAVQHAARLARTVGAKLTLLHVIPDAHRELDPGNDLSSPAEAIEAQWREAGEHALDEGQQDASALGVEIQRDHRPAQGRSVARAILEECEALKADLLVMATHGRKGILAHLIHGSVAEEVVHDTHIPVLLLHMDDEGKGGRSA